MTIGGMVVIAAILWLIIEVYGNGEHRDSLISLSALWIVLAFVGILVGLVAC